MGYFLNFMLVGGALYGTVKCFLNKDIKLAIFSGILTLILIIWLVYIIKDHLKSAHKK